MSSRYSLDNTEVNSWDRQSQNGYIVRIILLGLYGGCLGGTGQLGEISSSAGQPAQKKPRTANIGWKKVFSEFYFDAKIQ